MTFVPIDRILLEVSPGEARAVAFSGDEPWEIAIERPYAGPAMGDVYRVQASGLAQGGGRFFDMGGGISGLARRPRDDWTEGAYGLAQVLRGAAGDKGPRISDRVWLHEGPISVALDATGPVSDRIEIARRASKQVRERLRQEIAEKFPPDAALHLSNDPGPGAADKVLKVVERLRALAGRKGAAGRVHAAAGEIGWLAERAPAAIWMPADLASAAWLASRPDAPENRLSPDRSVAAEIDAAIADATLSEVSLDGGARLWIEPTHALVAIDVDRAEATVPGAEVNRAAGQEIVRQLRLRRLGGIVAVDFLRDGISEGIAALEALAGGDPWPWQPPRAPEASGLVAFQRFRSGPSLAETSTGGQAVALSALRAAARAADRGERPVRLAAPPRIIHLLQTDLAPALQDAGARMGRSLDLERTEALGSWRIQAADGQTLDEA